MDSFTADKDPQSTLDYTIDWVDWLVQGDSLSTATWAFETIVGESSLVITQQLLSGTKAIAWIRGGSLNGKYKLINTIQTAQGRIDQRTIVISIKDF